MKDSIEVGILFLIFAKLPKLQSLSESDEADVNEIPDELEHDDGRIQTARRRDGAEPHGDGQAAERGDQEVECCVVLHRFHNRLYNQKAPTRALLLLVESTY